MLKGSVDVGFGGWRPFSVRFLVVPPVIRLVLCPSIIVAALRGTGRLCISTPFMGFNQTGLLSTSSRPISSKLVTSENIPSPEAVEVRSFEDLEDFEVVNSGSELGEPGASPAEAFISWRTLRAIMSCVRHLWRP